MQEKTAVLRRQYSQWETRGPTPGLPPEIGLPSVLPERLHPWELAAPEGQGAVSLVVGVFVTSPLARFTYLPNYDFRLKCTLVIPTGGFPWWLSG